MKTKSETTIEEIKLKDTKAYSNVLNEYHPHQEKLPAVSEF